MKNWLIPILMLSMGAFIAWFIFFRKTQTATAQQPKQYAYGAPAASFDVPGPTVEEYNLLNQPLVKLSVI